MRTVGSWPKSLLFAAAVSLTAAPAGAGYEPGSDLHPAVRCEGIPEDDCQKLFWDLPPATRLGQRALAAPDPATGYPNGMTDRPPPLYIADEDGDGEPDTGYEKPGDGRTLLCENPDEIPWWAPTGDFETVETTAGPQPHEFLEVRCRRGTRVHYGPWRVGEDPNVYDGIVRAIVRFRNGARLDRDGVPPDDRREWNTGVEFYNHTGSHHGTCRNPADPYANGCNNPNDPERASSEFCKGPDYQQRYDECPAEQPTSERCAAYEDFAVQGRAATQFPGRITYEYPDGRAMIALEDQLWTCNHHAVSELFYNGKHRNFRRQKGGTVGEMVLQFFTEPITDPAIRPLSFLGAGLVSVLTTYYPPFTVGASHGIWYAPYDLALASLAIHAHKRMVKGTVDVVPANPLRLESANPDCGGGKETPATHLMVAWHWDEGYPCEYWKDAGDGPVILRKGEALRWSCHVNNGVTPAAIRGLLSAGARTEDAASPVANLEGTVTGVLGFARPFGDLAADLAQQEPFRERLYGRQDPSVYRVRYGCEQTRNVPPGLPPVFPSVPCDPNPATADGSPVDAPYENPAQCTTGTGRCVPANVVFANIAEDEMCLLYGLYWPLERPVDADFNAAREGRTDDVLRIDPDGIGALAEDPTRIGQTGTPGALFKQVDDGGICNGCSKTGFQQIDEHPSDETNVTRFQ